MYLHKYTQYQKYILYAIRDLVTAINSTISTVSFFCSSSFWSLFLGFSSPFLRSPFPLHFLLLLPCINKPGSTFILPPLFYLLAPLCSPFNPPFTPLGNPVFPFDLYPAKDPFYKLCRCVYLCIYLSMYLNLTCK